MGTLTVDPVGAEGLAEFVEVARRVRGGDADWLPPFTRSALAELGAGIPGGALEPFVARRDGRAIGRVAALVNPALRDGAGRPVGQVGHYECSDDPAAAAALLSMALDWLRARGCRTAVGPMNGGAHRAYRLLVEGFGTDPFLFEPRTPARYVDHFVVAGFAPVFRWSSHEPDRDQVAALAGRLERLGGRGRFRLDDVRSSDPGEVLPRLHPLLDRAWAGFPGYVPFSLAELGQLFGPVLVLLPPHHLYVVQDEGGGDVGFGYMMPDWSEEVRALGDDPSRWGSWMGGPLPSRIVLHTLAMAPEARRGSAVASLAAIGIRRALEAGYQRFVMALSREDFRGHVRGLRPTRGYALFGRAL